MRTTPLPPPRTIKPEVIALVVLVPVVIIMGLLLWRWPSSSTISPAISTPAASPATAPTQSASAIITATPTAEVVTPQTQHVQIRVVAQGTQTDYQVPLTTPTSVANVMTQAQAQGLQIKTRDYGGSLGLFFEEINGVANDPVAQLYWHLYVNGERSPLGASGATVAAGDQVMWKFEVMKSEE